MGFPGSCHHICSYTLKHDAALHIVLTTVTDAPTVANLAPHSYFTLNGGEDCRGHALRIDTDHCLSVDDELIPTGEIAPVENTVFDFANCGSLERRMRASMTAISALPAAAVPFARSPGCAMTRTACR